MDKDAAPAGIDRIGAARAEYVQGNVSLRSLAKRHSVSLRTLAEASSKEGWVQQREQFRSRVATESDAAAVEWQAEYLAKGRKLAAANALLLMELVHNLVRGTKDARAAAKAKLLGLSPKEAAELSKASGAAFKALCEAAGVTPIDDSAATVELPADPLSDLEQGVSRRGHRQKATDLELVSGEG